MRFFEIDHIEVSDNIIEVTYWLSEFNEKQILVTKVIDFEKWLTNQRDISISAYWDQWDSIKEDDISNQIVIKDIKQYLIYRFGLDKSVPVKHQVFSNKKPMTRVSSQKKHRGTRSA